MPNIADDLKSAFDEGYEAGKRDAIEHGEWIKYKDKYGVWHYDCPFCEDGYATSSEHDEVNFCSNCGAKLVSEVEE